MNIPDPVRLYRLVHNDNLSTLLERQALHAPHFVPDDGLEYHTIHDVSIQAHRHLIPIPPSKHELRSHYEPLELRWNSS